jgi:DNA polymerase-3 subunit epsilon
LSNSYIVFDFETTGLSPAGGDRAIEIGAVLVVDGEIKDKFQSLMNPGKKITPFIESYTGISNSMLSKAPSNAVSMANFMKFIGKTPLIAHNASFDKRFLDFELDLIGKEATQPVACSLRVARRLYQDAPNHKLQTLIEMNQIKVSGNFHRALADAEMTAQLWMKMHSDLSSKYKLQEVNFRLMQLLSSVPKKDIDKFISKQPQVL